MPAGEVAEITDTIECTIVGDRMRFTLVSGKRKEDFSCSFGMARNACHVALALLDQATRTRLGGNVRPLRPDASEQH